MEKNVFTTEQEERAALKRRRRNRVFNTILYLISASLILFGIFIILRDQTDLFNRSSAEKPNVTFPPADYAATSTATDAANENTEDTSEQPTKPPPEATPEPAIEPVSIFFEGHEIAVAVQPVGLNSKGEMETIPKHDVAGWYKYGAAPNQEGNCIIAGHNRYSGQKGLFAVLHKGLHKGDRVCVTMKDGKSIFYVVDEIANYKYDSMPESVMAAGGERRLTLITCLGDFDYDRQMSLTRVVAVCKPIN